MNLKAILTATGLGTALAFTAFPTGAPAVWTLRTTIASAEEHHEENENDPAEEAKELSVKINREKAEGNDVSAAVAHQQKGEAAMKAGNTKEALEHFEEARNTRKTSTEQSQMAGPAHIALGGRPQLEEDISWKKARRLATR